MTHKNLENLDKKFWKKLKKDAGIKKSGFFKKADASIGKYIEKMNSARGQFEHTELASDLLKYQKALQELDDQFEAFVKSKHLDDISDVDLKKNEKEELVDEIREWQKEISDVRDDLDLKLKNLLKLTEGNLDKIDSMESDKKRQVWNKMGLDI